jgi:uncharacterized membrane protein (UPF0127 family)
MIATRGRGTRPGRLPALVLVGLATVAPACGGAAPAGPAAPPARLLLGSGEDRVVLRVEVADTPAERARGLMGRERLPADAGMVFLFDRATRAGFWMKDTRIPLSIAFWDGRGRIVAMLDMEPCRRDPCPVYRPDVAYVGAVEANRGFFQRHGIEVGDEIELVGADP